MSSLQTIRPTPEPSWLWRAWDALRSSWSGPLTSSSPELARYFSDGPSPSGVSVSPDSALSYPAFWAAVSLISSDIASLPLILYRREPNGGKSRFTDHNLYRILHDEPNPEMSSFIMRETMQAHALVWGNAYAEIERDQLGRVRALWPLTPTQVDPARDRRTQALVYRVTNEDGTQVVMPASDVLHVPGLGYDGYVGYSVLAKARESLGLGLAMQRFGSKFFANGSRLSGVFTASTPLGPGKKESIATELRKFHEGVENAHRFALLEGGLDYKALGVPPDDAQFLESRSFHIQEIARWFRLSPHKLADLSRATFSNIEQLQLDHVTGCLRQWCVRWEQEINRKLIAPSERRIQFTEHLVDGLLRGDLLSRYQAYAVGRNWGWLSADDVLEKENMNPLPGGQGKIYLVPSNMAPADRINDIIDAQTAPPPAPVAPTPAPEPDPTAARALTVLEERFRLADASLVELKAEAESARTKAEALINTLSATEDEKRTAITRADEAEAARMQVQALADGLRADLDRERTEWTSTETELQTQLEDSRARAAAAAQQATDAETKRIDAERKMNEAIDTVSRLEQTASADDAARREAEQRALDAIAAADAAKAEADLALTLRDEALAQAQARSESLAAAERERDDAAATALRSADDARRANDSRSQIETTLRDVSVAERERAGAVLTAHRSLIVDVMCRMIERETERARRAQTTPEKLRNWLGTFYPAHTELMVAALMPAVRVHCAWMGRQGDTEGLTRQLVAQHIEESKRQISAVADGDSDDLAGSLYQLFERWDRDRVSVIADTLLQKEIERAAQS